jgi:XTP/dITP diphosphohydrolase
MSERPVVVAATANPGKLAEISEILEGVVELRPRPAEVPDVVEDAPDLVGNARLKARAIASATGLAALADDTGLEVAALDGAPGVRSARFAGEDATDDDNVTLLLESLERADDRRATFHTVAIVVAEGGEVICHGRCDGVIATERRGEGGFGYDPVFVPNDGDGRTFAEMASDEKHRISHRGRALRALAAELLDHAG